MKLHYKGKFNGDVKTLPENEDRPNAVMFKEFKSPKVFSLLMNILSVVLLVPLGLVYFWRCDVKDINMVFIGAVISLIMMVPHEILHALCCKGDVDLYIYPKGGSLFVIPFEDMSKKQFVFMSLLPNIVFGFVPFIIFLCFPQFTILGAVGFVSIPMGVGDYTNVFNALTQMPKGAKTYLNGFNSYWYMPNQN